MLPRYSSLKSSLYWSGFNLLALLFRWRRNANYLAVRYEDFCNDPQTTVTKIFAHCGVADDGLDWFSNKEVEVSPQHSISGNPSRFNVGKVVVKPDTAWQTRMSAGARRIVTLACGILFPVFGYRVAGDPSDDEQPVPDAAGSQPSR